MKLLLVLILAVASLSWFTGNDKPVQIPQYPQRSGDEQKGYEYLTTGDYVRSGIPYKTFMMAMNKSPVHLKREGLNEKIPHDFTAIKASNGEILVAPNCLQCHSQVFDGKLVVGLGNSLVDFSSNSQQYNQKTLQLVRNFLKNTDPKAYEAASPFFTVTSTLAPGILAPTRGVNVAGKLTALLVSHRDPFTLKWTDSSLFNVPDELIPSDTPPWWLLKKKNGMFYNGFGRGDFGKFLMASNLLTVNDSSESRQVDAHMGDVLSYIYSIQPPKYTRNIDKKLAEKGRRIFNITCSGCHGTYGDYWTYPNLLIPSHVINTDTALFAANYQNPQFINWFNKSWFTTGDHPAQLVPYRGYIAPPLDGIWISAPYLHNGSVPTIEALLNSKLRPRFWSRNFEKTDYDYEKLGYVFTIEKEGGSNSVYDAGRKGYGNGGHTFGDKLSAKERKAVIEYLKTL